MTTYVLELPYTRPPLSLNVQLNRYVANKLRQEIKHAVMVLAVKAKLPKRCEWAAITLTYHPPTRARRDEDNLFATFKPCADGLVAYGLVADDSADIVTSRCCIGSVEKPGALTLTIEVPDVVSTLTAKRTAPK